MINSSINKILKEHQGGEQFFDALDDFIRNEENLLREFQNRIREFSKGKEFSVVASGKFGKKIQEMKVFKDVVLANGGIRKGDKVILSGKPKSKNIFFIDDSLYSGGTMKSIDKALETFNQSIHSSFFIYDGSRSLQKNSFSFFRYFS